MRYRLKDMQGVPIFTNFIRGVQKCWNITGGAWVLNRGCSKERGFAPLLGRWHACVVLHRPQHCVPLFTETYKIPCTSFREIFIPAQTATPWPILTHVDTEQPKFEMIPLVLLKDLVCVPDQGDSFVWQGVRLEEPSLRWNNSKTLPRKFIASFWALSYLWKGVKPFLMAFLQLP